MQLLCNFERGLFWKERNLMAFKGQIKYTVGKKVFAQIGKISEMLFLVVYIHYADRSNIIKEALVKTEYR